MISFVGIVFVGRAWLLLCQHAETHLLCLLHDSTPIAPVMNAAIFTGISLPAPTGVSEALLQAATSGPVLVAIAER